MLGLSASRYLVVGLMILSVALMRLDSRQMLTPLHRLLAIVTAPIVMIVDKPMQWRMNIQRRLSTQRRLLTENAALQAQQRLLSAKLQRYLSLEAENEQLHQLLASTASLKSGRMQLARPLAVNIGSGRTSELLLAQSDKQSVRVGQVVLDAKGIMGQVIDAGPFTSRVLLITDPRSAIPVVVVRTGLRALIVGQGERVALALTHLPRTADIQVGDHLLSSGLGGRYPAGYPVAQVSQVQDSPSASFLHIQAAPSAQLDRDQPVLVLAVDRHPALKQ